MGEVILDIPAPAEHLDELTAEYSQMSDPDQYHIEWKNHPTEFNQHRIVRSEKL
jgi:hypothetical protein